MKNIFPLIASVAMLALFSCGTEDSANGEANGSGSSSSDGTSFTIDTQASRLKWKGGMIAAYGHEGTLAITDGTFTLNGEEVVAGEITVDMTSIAAVDKNFNPDAGQTKEALAGHLMSADFFDVENHPTATFKISAAGNGDVAGDLTVKGITKRLKIAGLTGNQMENGGAISGSFTFNRQDFGVAYENTMSDLILSDDIEVIFRIIGK